MSFVDFFRPKWKHSDPEVRAEAVRDLESPGQLATVLRTDEDARVRRIALKKVSDPEVLAEVGQSDADESLRRAAAEKANELFLSRAVSGEDEGAAQAAMRRISHGKVIAEVARTAAHEGVRRAALARITDDKHLLDVVRNAKDAALRRAALERVHDGEALRDFAIGETRPDLALVAVAQIQDTATLEQVAKRAKNKQVAAAARERLPQAMGRVERASRGAVEASPEARTKARQVQLLRELEQAISIDDHAQAEQAIAEVRGHWAEVAPASPDDEHQKRFDRALEKFAVRTRTLEEALRAHHVAEAGAKERRERAPEAPVAEDPEIVSRREALCVRAEALEGDEARVQLEAIRVEWFELPRLVGPKGKELEIRFRKASDAVLRRAELQLGKGKARERLEAVVAEAEAVAGPLKERESQLRILRKRVAELEALVSDEELRARFRAVEERVEAEKAEIAARRAAEDAESQRRLEEAVARVEELAQQAEPDRKRIEQELKVTSSAFESSKLRGPTMNALRDRYGVVRDKLAARAQELRDAEEWKRWTNVPKLELLCAGMEAIAAAIAVEQHGTVKTAAAPAGKEGAAAPTEAAAAPTEAAAATPAAPATESAPAAPVVVTAAPTPPPGVGELPIFDEAGRVDVKKALAAMRVLQAEWKQVGPAPKERSEQLWQRFKIAGDEVYHRASLGSAEQGASREDNLKKKEELCAAVEALAAPFAGQSEGAEGAPPLAEWTRTADKIKALQEEWKKVGPVERAKADELWKRFRAACDVFFGKRKEVNKQASEERGSNLRRLEELCARVEALADSTDVKKAAAEIKAAQAEWKTVGPAPRGDSDKVWKRFRAACDRFFERRNSQFAEQDAERTGNLAKKEALCEKAEALVARVAEDGDRDLAMREAKQLQAEWKKAGPVPREHGDAIWRRFRAACDKVFNPEEEAAPAVPAPEGDPRNWPKFENKLPLAGVLAQLSGEREPEPAAPPVDAEPPQ